MIQARMNFQSNNEFLLHNSSINISKNRNDICNTVKVELKTGLVEYKPKEDYQQTITEHAKDGWRFVQIFTSGRDKHAGYFELIFEKKVT